MTSLRGPLPICGGRLCHVARTCLSPLSPRHTRRAARAAGSLFFFFLFEVLPHWTGTETLAPSPMHQ